MRLTLDTSCVIYASQLAENRKLGDRHAINNGVAVERLVTVARAGKAMLALSTGFDADQVEAAQRSANLEWLEARPIVRIPGAFRIGLSPRMVMTSW